MLNRIIRWQISTLCFLMRIKQMLRSSHGFHVRDTSRSNKLLCELSCRLPCLSLSIVIEMLYCDEAMQ